MAIKPGSHNLTAEKLRDFDLAKLELLRANALRLGAEDVVRLCDDEIAKRPPRRTPSKRSSQDHGPRDVVTGYHFVCAQDRGVTDRGDGRFWSGSWVVASRVAEDSVRFGAYLALHETKSRPSYRQGRVLNCRTALRGMVERLPDGGDVTEEGIEFLVQSTDQPYDWVGTGTGEKGYLWEKLVTRGDRSADDHQDGE